MRNLLEFMAMGNVLVGMVLLAGAGSMWFWLAE